MKKIWGVIAVCTNCSRLKWEYQPHIWWRFADFSGRKASCFFAGGAVNFASHILCYYTRKFGRRCSLFKEGKTRFHLCFQKSCPMVQWVLPHPQKRSAPLKQHVYLVRSLFGQGGAGVVVKIYAWMLGVSKTYSFFWPKPMKRCQPFSEMGECHATAARHGRAVAADSGTPGTCPCEKRVER